jgi:hypothetical protein
MVPCLDDVNAISRHVASRPRCGAGNSRPGLGVGQIKIKVKVKIKSGFG